PDKPMQPDLPDRVRQVLDGIVDAARRAFGDDLRSVVLYGSAAEGRLRATSDVNVMFVLARFDETKANHFREPFRFACAAADASGPLRTAAAAIVELEGRGTLAPKEALYTFVHDLGPSDFVELLPHLSEAREKRVLPPGRAADLLYTTVELAGVLHDRAMAL